MSVGKAASPPSQKVTILYEGKVFGESMPDLCTYGKAQGLNLECLPLPNLSGEKESMIIAKSENGSVIFPADIAFWAKQAQNRMVDLKPMIVRESKYRDVLESLWMEPGGIISRLSVKGIYFNTAALRDMGMSVPPASYTWDNLISFLKQLETKSLPASKDSFLNSGINLSASEFLSRYIISAGGNVSFADPKTAYDQALGEGLAALRELKNAGITIGAANKVDNLAFPNGIQPVMVNTLGYSRQLPANLEWQVRPFPVGRRGYSVPDLQPAEGWAIAGQGAINEAWRILLWMIVGDGAAYYQKQWPMYVTPLTLVRKQPSKPELPRDSGIEMVYENAVKALSVPNVFQKQAQVYQTLQKTQTFWATCTLSSTLPIEICQLGLEKALPVFYSKDVKNASPITPPSVNNPITPKKSQIIRILKLGGYSVPTTALQASVSKYLPDVHIEVSNVIPATVEGKLQNTLISGDYDLILSEEQNLAKTAIVQGLVQPLDTFLVKEKNHSRVWSDLVNEMRINNRVYDLPFSIMPTFVLYDVDMILSRGLSQPKQGWTWDEFRQKASKLTDRNRNPAYFGAGSRMANLIWPLMVRQSNKGGYSSNLQTYTTTLRLLWEMVTQDQSLQFDAQVGVSAVLGDVAMEFADQTSLQKRGTEQMSTATAKRLGVVTSPGINPALQGTESRMLTISIASTSKKTNLAWQVASLLSGPLAAQFMAEQGVLSANPTSDAALRWTQFYKPGLYLEGIDTLANIKVWANRHYSAYDALRQAMMQQSLALCKGETSFEEVIKAVEDAIQTTASH